MNNNTLNKPSRLNNHLNYHNKILIKDFLVFNSHHYFHNNHNKLHPNLKHNNQLSNQSNNKLPFNNCYNNKAYNKEDR